MKNNNMTDQLFSLVESSMDDIIHDYVKCAKIEHKTIEEVESDTDDGVAYGKYNIIVNDVIVVTVEASGVYQGFQDCGGPDNHYTKDVYFEELEDYQYDIIKYQVMDRAIDEVINNDIQHAKGE